MYLACYLHEKAKYAEPEQLSVHVRQDSIPPLTFLEVFNELLLQTLLARGFIDVVTKPLVETHPPLHLRLRVFRDAQTRGVQRV